METDQQKEHKEAFLRYVRRLETKADKLAEEHDKLQARCDALLKVCKNSPAPDIFASFAGFAEECSEKPSMAVYKARFLGLATFLRSCTDRSEVMMQAIAETEKQGIIHGVNGIECGFPDRKEQAKK